MARKTPGDDLGQKRRRSKPKNKEPEETPPPLTAEEFEQAFKQYCSEKDVTCRLRRKLHGRDVAVHALYNYVASFGGPKGASSQRAWSRVADMLSPGASHKAGVANELSKLYAATLGGFAPVALGMFPDAADRPHGAYQDLTPASLPDEAQEPETNGEDTRTAPRAPPRVSAAQLKALKRFGAVQSGGSVKRPRLEGPSGPLSRLPTKNTSSFILLNGSASGPRSRDGDDSDGGGGGAGGGRLLGRRPMSSGLPPLKVSPAGGLLVPPGSPDHHHPPSAHRAHHHGHHHHHGHGGGQHGMSLLGSSPRGVKLSQHRAPGGAFGTLLEDFEQEPQDGMLGGIDLAKAVQRTHGIGKVRGGVTYVETEPDDDWRPPAAVCISTEHEWRLGGSAFKEQKYGPGALKGMLAWLRHLSTAVGTAEIMTEALSDSEEAQEYQQAQTAIVLQTYLGRFRREAFHGLEASGYVDTRIDPANVRRSGRTRQPTYELEFKPAPVTAAAEASEGSEWDSEDEEPGVRHGEEFQVEAIPRCRRLLDKMSASERHWLSRLVARRGGVRLPPLPPEPHDFEHMSLEERLETVTQSTAALRKALGPHCAAIGLGTLGTAAVQPAWTDAEEALLEEGMRAWGRDFRQIQKQLLPAKSASDLVIFYYNVWKTRGTPRARAWWHAVEEARKQEEEEEAMWEAARAEADRKRVDSHHAATQNRQLRDMLGWQRLLARNPRDPVIKPRSKERIARVVDVLHEQAMDVLTAEAGPRPEFIVIPAP